MTLEAVDPVFQFAGYHRWFPLKLRRFLSQLQHNAAPDGALLKLAGRIGRFFFWGQLPRLPVRFFQDSPQIVQFQQVDRQTEQGLFPSIVIPSQQAVQDAPFLHLFRVIALAAHLPKLFQVSRSMDRGDKTVVGTHALIPPAGIFRALNAVLPVSYTHLPCALW